MVVKLSDDLCVFTRDASQADGAYSQEMRHKQTVLLSHKLSTTLSAVIAQSVEVMLIIVL